MLKLRWALLEIDGYVSVGEDGAATMACVVRNETGQLLIAAGWSGVYLTAEETELRAAWEIIRLIKEKFSGDKVWLEGDAIEVIKKLKDQGTEANASILLEHARRLMHGLDLYRISHTSQERNKCADWKTARERNAGGELMRLA